MTCTIVLIYVIILVLVQVDIVFRVYSTCKSVVQMNSGWKFSRNCFYLELKMKVHLLSINYCRAEVCIFMEQWI